MSVVLTGDRAVHEDPHALRTGARVVATADGGVEVRFPDGTVRR